MKEQVQQLFAVILRNLGVGDAEIHVEFPESASHGDFTTNIAMMLSKRLNAPPRKIAQQIIDAIKIYQSTSQGEWIAKIDIAGPGFINITVTDGCFGNVIREVLEKKDAFGTGKFEIRNSKFETNGEKTQAQNKIQVDEARAKKIEQKNVDKKGINSAITVDTAGKEEDIASIASRGDSKTVMVEFAHPNTHKAFHIGHLRNITTGESIVRLLESQGNTVIRANYQGDVGMHIAKALYALTTISPFKDDVHTVVGIKERTEFLGKAYAAGSTAYEGDEDAKKKIGDINKQIYAKDPVIYELYCETRQWSLDYFETIYKRVYTHYDRYYFESDMYEKGTDFVRDGVKRGIFEESKGAIIFPGEKFGLHNRVFITGEGNATYEGKEIALGRLQFDEYDPKVIIHCVGPEQAGYFQVLFKALEQMFPETTGREYHLTYGWVKLKEGKMSSRSGNVILGEWLIDEVKKSIYKIMKQNASPLKVTPLKDETAETLAIGAIKYAFLKVSTNQEIAFDLKESINTNGDSGPYIMYAYARCKSVLRKAQEASMSALVSSILEKSEEKNLNTIYFDPYTVSLNSDERLVARLLMQFPDIVKSAADNYAPNTLCTYLFQLAQAFNVFYGKNPIVGDNQRVALTSATAQVLKNGLYLLGINVLERM